MLIPFKNSQRIIFYIFLLLGCYANAQNRDVPLLNKWNLAKQSKTYLTDSNSVIILNELSDYYLFNQPDSALFYSKQALQISLHQTDNKISKAIAANGIARAYYILGNYPAALEANDVAFDICKKVLYNRGIGSYYINTGLISVVQERYDDAINEFNNALIIAEKVADSARLANINFNIGLAQENKHDFDKAFNYLNKAIAISSNIKDWHIYLMSLNRLGETNYDVGNYTLAIDFYQKALDFDKYKDNWENSFANSGLAQTYYALKNYNKSIDYALKSLVYSTQMNAISDVYRSQKILSDSYAAVGDFEKAYTSQLKLKIYSDTLFNQTKEREINFLNLKQNKLENLTLIKENDLVKQKLTLNRFVIFSISLLAIFLVVIVLIIKRNANIKHLLNKELTKKNSDIAIQNEEILSQKETLVQLNNTKNIVFSVISHDMRSPFAILLTGLSLLRDRSLSREMFDTILDRYQKDLISISGMLNNVLQWAVGQQEGFISKIETIALPNIIDEIIELSSILTLEKEQQINHHKSDATLLINADPNHVKIIFQNLLSNAMKFTPAGGKIDISYSENEKYTALHVKDSGVGMSEDKIEKLFKFAGKKVSDFGTNKESGNGIGLLLIKQVSEINGGYLDVKSVKGVGSEFIVYFKK